MRLTATPTTSPSPLQHTHTHTTAHSVPLSSQHPTPLPVAPFLLPAHLPPSLFTLRHHFGHLTLVLWGGRFACCMLSHGMRVRVCVGGVLACVWVPIRCCADVSFRMRSLGFALCPVHFVSLFRSPSVQARVLALTFDYFSRRVVVDFLLFSAALPGRAVPSSGMRVCLSLSLLPCLCVFVWLCAYARARSCARYGSHSSFVV